MKLNLRVAALAFGLTLGTVAGAVSIWGAASVTPVGTYRIPVDVSSSGAPSQFTVTALDTFLSATTSTLTNKTLGTGAAATVAITFSDNVRQTFNPGANASGLNVGAVATTNPDTLVEGDLWVNADTSQLLTRVDGITWDVAKVQGTSSLTDPGADRIAFWDESANTLTWLTAGTGLTITGTTITAAGGVTGFTAAETTSSPNDTVYADSIIASGATTNADAVFGPKAAGAIQGEVADSGTGGGNKRGANAVDWQTSTRSAATQVASGGQSVIGGGLRNTAIGLYSTVAGGNDGSAGLTGATVGGGEGNNASTYHATVSGGYYNAASGDNSNASGGRNNTASGVDSWVPGGRQGLTRGLAGAYAYSGGARSAAGDAQVIGQPVRRTTADATPVSMATDGTAASTTVMVLPSGGTNTCLGLIVARSSASSAGFEVRGLVENNAGTTSLLGTAACVAIGTPDAALTTASCAITANDTLDSAEITVTGVAATTINWSGELRCVQVL